MSLRWKGIFSLYGACLCFLAGLGVERKPLFACIALAYGVVFVCMAAFTPEPKEAHHD